MRDFDTILRGFMLAVSLAVFAGISWAIYHWDIFPRKRLKNFRFDSLKVGQVFFDFGGEELQLREYIKTGEGEAQCLSVTNKPIVKFEEKDVVKIEVFTFK